MKSLIKLEEFAQLLGCLILLAVFDVPWWTYLILLLGPDISMLGYLIDTRVGAVAYNLFHHKGIALLVGFTGGYLIYLSWSADHPLTAESALLVAGLILYGHSSLDRTLGYGLKFGDHFQHTHLGWIGKGREANSPKS
jgi:hypothetical protein